MTIENSGNPLGLNGTCTGSSSARNQIGAEVGKTAGTALCMNNSSLRTLSGTSSSTALSFSNFYGKSNSYTYTVSSNQTNFCMRAGAVSAGWNGSSNLIVNINSGVIISSNSTGTPAMTITGSFPNGVTVKNSGTIVGMGGNGGIGSACNGYCGSPYGGNPGSGGGTALRIASAVTICNSSGVIAGGGGGGGGGGGANGVTCCGDKGGAGGGGGGGRSSNAANSSGGPGNRAYFQGACSSPGGSGTYSSAGGGGAHVGCLQIQGGDGGSGGGWGSTGGSGSSGTTNGYPYRFYPPSGGGSGGSGGKATCGASNVTWTATGTRYGSIS